jgi:hypothetical protein
MVNQQKTQNHNYIKQMFLEMDQSIYSPPEKEAEMVAEEAEEVIEEEVIEEEVIEVVAVDMKEEITLISNVIIAKEWDILVGIVQKKAKEVEVDTEVVVAAEVEVVDIKAEDKTIELAITVVKKVTCHSIAHKEVVVVAVVAEEEEEMTEVITEEMIEEVTEMEEEMVEEMIID